MTHAAKYHDWAIDKAWVHTYLCFDSRIFVFLPITDYATEQVGEEAKESDEECVEHGILLFVSRVGPKKEDRKEAREYHIAKLCENAGKSHITRGWNFKDVKGTWLKFLKEILFR